MENQEGISLSGMFIFGKHPLLVSYQLYKHYFAWLGSRFWSRHSTCWKYISGFNIVPHKFYRCVLKYYEV